MPIPTLMLIVKLITAITACVCLLFSSEYNELRGEDMEEKTEKIEQEVVELFVRLADMLSLPRSYGEIYGCLYITEGALCMEELISKLKISKGSASQGLKALRNIGAIKTVYKPGDRRDFYEAECELRKLVAGFLRDQVDPHLESGRERVQRMRQITFVNDGDGNTFLKERIEQLDKWRQRAETILPWAIRMIEK